MPGAWIPAVFAPGASDANIALFRSGAINADQLRATVGLGPMQVDSPGVFDTALSSPATLVIAGVLTAGLADVALTAGEAAAADGTAAAGGTAAGTAAATMPPAILDEAAIAGMESGGLQTLINYGTNALIKVGTQLVISYGLGLISGTKSASDGLDRQGRGALINAISNVEPIKLIYGSRRVGCAIVLLEVSGASNEFLNIVCVWGEGPISAINTIYLNDVAITDARFAGLYTRTDYTGTDTQAADTALIAALGNPAKWNANCTLSGVAYTYLQLKWSASAFAGGLPNITGDVDGILLYDPRTALTAFSHNAALAVRDYLTNTRYGRGIASAMIDDTAFQSAANTCDEAVSIPGGGTQARYTADGVVDVNQKPIDNLRALLTSCRGFLVYSGGLYKLRIEKAETPVALTLSEDNIVGGWSFSMGSKRSRYNRVKARFFNPAAGWQPDIAVQDSTIYRASDNGLLLEASQLELPFTTDAYRAGQIAQIELKRSRLGILASCTATVAAMALEVGDVVPVTHATPGWSAKSFRVIEMELQADDEVKLTLLEYDAAVYTLDALVAVSTVPTTNLPNPLTVTAPGITGVTETLYSTTGSAGVKSKATVAWTGSDIYVQSGGQYQVEYQLTTDTAWTIGATVVGTQTSADVFDLAAAAYNFRVRARNSLGAEALSATFSQTLFGVATAPASVTNFLVQNYAGKAKFTWDKPSSVDVLLGGRVIVRWSPRTDGSATWDYGSTVNPDGYPGDTAIGEGPLSTGTYLAKLVTSSGVYSDVAASYTLTEALLTGLTTIATVTESPTFAGGFGEYSPIPAGVRHNRALVIDGVFKLDSIFKIDDMGANIDDWGAIDALGGTNVLAGITVTGGISNYRNGNYYVFANKLDLGSKTPCRLFASIDSLAFDADDLWDNRTDAIDSWTSLVDGVDINDIDMQLYVRTTDDDPAGTPTWSAYERLGQVADYNFRAFDFKLMWDRGGAFNSTHNRQVSALSVTAKH